MTCRQSTRVVSSELRDNGRKGCPLAVLAIFLASLVASVPSCSTEAASQQRSAESPSESPRSTDKERLIARIEIRSLPAGKTIRDVQLECEKGVVTPGDIEVVDLTKEIGGASPTLTAESGPPLRVAMLDGSGLEWHGEARPRSGVYGIDFYVIGLQAARAIARPRGPAMENRVCVLIAAGWTEQALAMADAEWHFARTTEGRGQGSGGGKYSFVAGISGCIADEQRNVLFQRWIQENIQEIEGLKNTETSRLAAIDITRLIDFLPGIASVPAVIRRMQDAGLQGSACYLAVIRSQRVRLVNQQAYSEAIDGDSDPVDAWLDDEFWRGIAINVARVVPIPAPRADSSAKREEAKRLAIQQMHGEYRDKGIALYEALIARDRTLEASRMRAELISRLPMEGIEKRLDEARDRAERTRALAAPPAATRHT